MRLTSHIWLPRMYSHLFRSYLSLLIKWVWCYVCSAGIILRKSKLYEAALSAERKVKALMTVMQVVTNHDATMQDVIYGILRVAADAINSDRVDIFFVDKDKMFTLAEGETSRLHTNIYQTLYFNMLLCMMAIIGGPQIEFPVGFGVAGHCAATGEPVNIANAYDDSHFKAEFDEKLNYRTQVIHRICIYLYHCYWGLII
jgi:dual 3',5'-cyclic-AMP and -GMP phosphodiesterase 11